MKQPSDMLQQVAQWIETAVIGWNLCPFAGREWKRGRVRLQLSAATTEEQLLLELGDELTRLDETPEIETTLLVHPQLLQDFAQYNQFLDYAEALLEQLGYEGVYQLASFHPDYQFAGTQPGDRENLTNRSPYPLLHILREDSVSLAIESHPDVEGIPLRNIEFMQNLSPAQIEATFPYLS